MNTATPAAPTAPAAPNPDGDDYTRTRAAVPTVPDAAAKTAVSGADHAADYPAEEDPIERITSSVPYIIPAAGALLIFLLAFIAIYMA